MSAKKSTDRQRGSMPDPGEDFEGCLDMLATMYGDEWLFVFLGKVRDHRGANNVAGVWRAKLAQQLVAEEMRASGLEYKEARFVVADRLGYTETTRTNFYKLLEGMTKSGTPIG